MEHKPNKAKAKAIVMPEMVNISIADICIKVDVSKLSSDKFEKYVISIFNDWERPANELLRLDDCSLTLYAEEGSVKIRTYIAVATIALFVDMSKYSSCDMWVESTNYRVECAYTMMINSIKVRSNVGVEIEYKKDASSVLQDLGTQTNQTPSKKSTSKRYVEVRRESPKSKLKIKSGGGREPPKRKRK